MFKIRYFALVIMYTPLLVGKNWVEHLESRKNDIQAEAFDIIATQQTAYQNNNAPKIADTIIKNIPITESNEPCVDLWDTKNNRITMLPNPPVAFFSPDSNSGLPAASKVRATVFEKLQFMVQELDNLAVSFGYVPGRVDIKVFEGLRDLATQEKLFNYKSLEIQKEYPEWTQEQIFTETCKWVSPVVNNVPVHSTGAAIDIRLWDNKNQEFLDMGMFGVIWGSNTSAPTFSENLTDLQKNNRLFLLAAATQAGLVNYAYEFWHFSYGDRYAHYWLVKEAQQRMACYGAVN